VPPLTLWLVIVGMGAITYGLRLSMIVFFGRVKMPEALRRALRFVPPAVLSAIVLPELLIPGGTFTLSPWNARLVAGVVAAAVAWRTGNVFLTIGTGMGLLWMLQFIW
jgi:branched-subunit amino acid transport protein